MNTEAINGLLSLLSTDFMAQFYQRAPLHVAGSRGQFKELLSWHDLNSFLAHQSLPLGSITVVKEGQTLDTSQYIRMEGNRAGRATRPVLKGPDLTRALREGATLVIDKIDDYHGPIQLMAERLEEEVNLPVSVNVYAGWRTTHGFNVHVDDHDVFIMQVHGRKYWKLFGRADVLPLPRTDMQPSNIPTESIWEGWLTEGDILYIPRGWWHVATPCDEPTVHLTVALAAYTRLDMLAWLIEQLKADPFMRLDMPQETVGAEQYDLVEGLSERFSECLRQPAVVERFWRHMTANLVPRTHFALPWAACPQVLPVGDYTVECMLRGRGGIYSGADEQTIDIHSAGMAYTFPAEASSLLKTILYRKSIKRSQLLQGVEDVCTGEQLDGLILDLVEHGLVVCSPTEEAVSTLTQHGVF